MQITGLAAASALSLTSASAEIVVNPNLSVSGFVDMSAIYQRFEYDDDEGDDSFSNNGAAVDQAEIDFALKFDKVTGSLELEYRPDSDSDGDDVTVEQAYVTYAFDEASSFTAGRFLSYMGYEGDEPYKLFQYSTAYDYFGVPYAGYNDGIKYDYTTEMGSFGVALVSANYNRTDRIKDEYGIELKGTLTPAEGLTLFLGYSKDQKKFDEDISFYNAWIQYQTGKLTTAAEFGYLDDDDGLVIASHKFWLLMASLGVTDTFTLTGRISGQNVDDGGPSNVKFTVSPSFKLNSNLLFVTELSYTDIKGMSADSALGLAAELLFTF